MTARGLGRGDRHEQRCGQALAAGCATAISAATIASSRTTIACPQAVWAEHRPQRQRGGLAGEGHGTGQEQGGERDRGESQDARAHGGGQIGGEERADPRSGRRALSRSKR